jgi:hypothetical protein
MDPLPEHDDRDYIKILNADGILCIDLKQLQYGMSGLIKRIALGDGFGGLFFEFLKLLHPSMSLLSHNGAGHPPYPS